MSMNLIIRLCAFNMNYSLKYHGYFLKIFEFFLLQIQKLLFDDKHYAFYYKFLYLNSVVWNKECNNSVKIYNNVEGMILSTVS